MNAMPTHPLRVGVIGLGLMGSVLLHRLIEAGFPTAAHDIDPDKCRQAEARGAILMPPETMAEQCDQIVLALFDTAQVEAVVETHLIPQSRRLPVICTSTWIC
jgi:3-hydroxyisobutyrate dehydrogenase-like beta-hydroxyacid dehydrogenase